MVLPVHNGEDKAVERVGCEWGGGGLEKFGVGCGLKRVDPGSKCTFWVLSLILQDRAINVLGFKQFNSEHFGPKDKTSHLMHAYLSTSRIAHSGTIVSMFTLVKHAK